MQRARGFDRSDVILELLFRAQRLGQAASCRRARDMHTKVQPHSGLSDSFELQVSWQRLCCTPLPHWDCYSPILFELSRYTTMPTVYLLAYDIGAHSRTGLVQIYRPGTTFSKGISPVGWPTARMRQAQGSHVSSAPSSEPKDHHSRLGGRHAFISSSDEEIRAPKVLRSNTVLQCAVLSPICAVWREVKGNMPDFRRRCNAGPLYEIRHVLPDWTTS